VPHTLLLADDSVTIQRVIELTFADEDIKVVAVSDGDQAIQRLDAAPPDIVLADIGMPGKNGYEVAQYVRQTPKLSHIPVVLLTGAFEPVDQARAAEAGCDGVLAKPFEPQLVIGRVRELLVKGHHSLSSAETVITGPFGAAAPAARPAAPEPPLDDYFDRLDAAFSSLGIPAAPGTAKAEPTLASPAAPPPSTASEIDWFNAAPAPAAAPEAWDLPADGAAAPPPADLPLSFGSPQADSAAGAPGAARVPAPEPVIDHHPAAFDGAGTTQFDAHASGVAPAPADAPLMDDHPAPLAGSDTARFDIHASAAAPADVVPTPAPLVEPTRDVAVGAASEAPASPTLDGPPPAPSPTTQPVPVPQPTAAGSWPVAAVAAAAMPSLGDAFAAILAAEQSAPSSPMPQWPAAVAVPTPAPEPAAVRAPEITDAMLDDVVRRVLERMSEAVVRDTASQFVSAIAERLVKEEIERIKASLK
jgi:CheY-like chemotaxis protein